MYPMMIDCFIWHRLWSAFGRLLCLLVLIIISSVAGSSTVWGTEPPASHDHGTAPTMTGHDHGAAHATTPPPPMTGHDHGTAPTITGHDHGAMPAVTPPPAVTNHDHVHTPAPPDTSGHDHAQTAPAPVSSGDGHGHVHAAPVLGQTGLGHGMGSGTQVMRHPGLPMRWILPAALLMVGLAIIAMLRQAPVIRPVHTYNLSTAPLIGWLVRFLNSGPWPLVLLRVISVLLFLLVVFSGLFGTPLAERSLATVFTWNLWWPLVVISVFFVSSAWCAICPWDTIANWLVRRRLWRRAVPHPGLNLKVPLWLRNVFPALLLFMGLTWLELGIGVTTIPQATALMALIMVVLSTAGLLIFERKAFCRYGCPVGRTMGLYARLAPIEVRSQRQAVCDTCKTMECYNGSQEIEPCPTHLTVGRFSQNTYCLSCGNCVLSCPHDNVSWRLRSMGSEAMEQARPQWDSAWFMLILLGITSFHGVTMMPFWTDWVVWIATQIGETGQLIASFTLGMWAGFLAPVAVYALAILATWWLSPAGTRYRRLFVTLSFSALPMAFTYHLAHNLSHLLREGGEWPALLLNPLGSGLLPMTPAERHEQMMTLWMPEEVMFASQAGLMVLGIWLAVAILRYRGLGLLSGNQNLVGWRLMPMLLFMGIMTAFDFWLLSEDMVMRF